MIGRKGPREMADASNDSTFDEDCMAALLDYVERYGLTEKARHALVGERHRSEGVANGCDFGRYRSQSVTSDSHRMQAEKEGLAVGKMAGQPIPKEKKP